MAHELAIDLQQIDGQLLEMAIGGETTAKVIQRKGTAQPLEGLDKRLGGIDVGDSLRFGDLKAETLLGKIGGFEQATDLAMHLRRAHRLT